MNFLVNAIPPKPFDVATSNFVLNRSHDVEGTGQLFVKVKDQIMYFLVNVSPPKRLDLATSNFVAG